MTTAKNARRTLDDGIRHQRSLHRERQAYVDAILEERSGQPPSESRQLEIRATALRRARELLRLDGAALRANMRAERALLDEAINVLVTDSRQESTVRLIERTATLAHSGATLATPKRRDGLTLTGVACPFNKPTIVVDAVEGAFVESFAPGAYTETLRKRTPLLMFDHGKHPLVGQLPLGKFTELRETYQGLYVRAYLTSNWLTLSVRDAIRDGGITGMSVRFAIDKEQWSQPSYPTRDNPTKLPVRRLLAVTLFEAGPVTWPQYKQTSIGLRGAHATRRS